MRLMRVLVEHYFVVADKGEADYQPYPDAYSARDKVQAVTIPSTQHSFSIATDPEFIHKSPNLWFPDDKPKTMVIQAQQ
jgi:hypothetical protein